MATNTEASLDAESRGSKFEEEKDIYIVSKCPPTNYLLIAKEKTETLQRINCQASPYPELIIRTNQHLVLTHTRLLNMLLGQMRKSDYGL